MAKAPATALSRRTLLIGGGVGAGLVIAWTMWPRGTETSLRAGPGETVFNAYLKIGSDGRVVVAVPQAELGQGVYTSLPQILADELGADWRTVAVEPAPLSPVYANMLLAEEGVGEGVPDALQGITRWAARGSAERSALMLTGGSSSIRAFERPLREAGAAARVLLSKAAADRWNVDWEEVETANGFVIHGGNRLSFAELAEAAAEQDVPDGLPMRAGDRNRLVGEPLPRIDVPAKIDGSARFAADVRLPRMVYASVRAGPIGDNRLERIDREAASRVPGLLGLFERETWVGAAASNWWAANRAVEAMKPVFETRGALLNTADAEAVLAEARESGEATRLFESGDVGNAFIGGIGFSAHYSAAPAASAALEPLSATVRIEDGQVEIWAAVQAPAVARAAAAEVAGVDAGQVIIYPMPGGGGYGRRLETEAITQAVSIARELQRPVQLAWSRLEEMTQDRYRPPAIVRLSARLGDDGRIAALAARIAAPGGESGWLSAGTAGAPDEADRSAVAGAVPPYGIPILTIEHVPANPGIPRGAWRSGMRSVNTFFLESFIDEVARRIGAEPMSFRIGMLGGNPRLARVLSTAANLGGWDGGATGGALGLACHAAYGSYAALLVEISVAGGQRIKVERAVCAVDCGRVINPEIVRQQIEGGLIYGIAAACGAPIGFEGGLPTVRTLSGLRFPRLADAPDVTVEIMPSEDDPGGVTELTVPLAAPAIANALFAASGQRLRSLPLIPGTG
ncbi:molybdopterin cofactor-binding domain-containing protein [Allosphingosinicella vermicomposti]|uniref:molybdopterin cofactor-binding domain-containing protein n=1 Tax=Allosphingosinicella vermicomposti TaxID=614671 RepID=UPI000D1012B0|nr:molybdopterin cofactor-binding domain-containing protein [Allosphingosinicella vermicomposti]